jgi:WD40 repeat protein
MVDGADAALVTSVAYDGAGGGVLAVGVDGTVSVWDAGDGTFVARWACVVGPVDALTVDRDRGLLLTAGYDGFAAVWRLADGGLVRRVAGLPAGALDAVPVGVGLAVACYDGTIRVWDDGATSRPCSPATTRR